jgi:predicted DNA-binding transcriptional regulator YafY
MARADRLFALVHLLSGGRRYRLEEISGDLGISPRSVYRDLADLESRGVPIERVDGTYRLMEGATIRPLRLTPVLALLIENPATSRQPAFRDDLRHLRAKLSAANCGARDDEETADAKVSVLAGPDRTGTIAPAVRSELENAIRDRRSLSILYTSLTDRRPGWRGIDPWALVHRSEAWYLVGRCHVHDDPRTFRLDRITGVLPIGKSFTRPPDFDVREWLESSWGILEGDAEVESVILFDPSVAPLIEHASHHASEKKQRLDDGSIEYRVHVGNLDEIARWIIGFAGAARAVAPPELIESVRKLATGALDAHATRKPPKSSRLTPRARQKREA